MSDAASLRWNSLRGDAALAVYIDLKSPYAYLAIEPTRQMAAGLGVAIDWRPFTLDIPSYLGSAKLGSDGRAARRAPGRLPAGGGPRRADPEPRGPRSGLLTGPPPLKDPRGLFALG